MKRNKPRVSLVLDMLAGGMKAEEITQEYDLTEEDILACIAYGAERTFGAGPFLNV